MNPGKYNWIHSLAAAIVMIAAVSNNFWHNFLHGGFTSPPPAKTLVTAVVMQIALTGLLLLILWASTWFVKKDKRGVCGDDTAGRGSMASAFKLTLKAFAPIAIIAFALQGLSMVTLEKVFHITAHGQDLVQWLKPGTYSAGIRLLLVFVAAAEAPLCEELLFRGIIFRGLAKLLPAFAAMAVSGLVFAVVHVNAVAFLPLWFLGFAFAWLYHRTGTILAPMTAHFLFNLLNLIFVFCGLTE